MNTHTPFSVILLAGGRGLRMNSLTLKQYALVCEKPLALYSFEVLSSLPEVADFVVVCEPEYASIFEESAKGKDLSLQFASPGHLRQDSVFNAMKLLRGNPLVCIHDAVRPLIDEAIVRRAVKAGEIWGASAVGVKVKSTIKVCNDKEVVMETPNRASLWEIQTPQIIRLNLLKEGFAYVQEHQMTVTDDVSLVEALGQPVKIEEGSYANIKVTTQEDLILVEKLIEKYVLLQTHTGL